MPILEVQILSLPFLPRSQERPESTVRAAAVETVVSCYWRGAERGGEGEEGEGGPGGDEGGGEEGGEVWEEGGGAESGVGGGRGGARDRHEGGREKCVFELGSGLV